EWTQEEDRLPGRFRKALTDQDPAWSALAQQLAVQRLDPLAPHLAATKDLPSVRRLLVVPISFMAGIPVEALTDRYAVSYVPSGTIFAKLCEKHRALDKPTLLALGDPEFKLSSAGPALMLPEHGVLLSLVLPGGNANKAGLHSGDVLLR